MAESNMDPSLTATSSIPTAKKSYPSVTINIPTPHTFDLGNLLVSDPNPLPPTPTPSDIATTARTCAQSLLNQLLTTCPIHTAPDASVMMTLPPPTTPLPREKPLPKEKEKTTWERFAAKKGIKDKRRGEGKVEYDEAKGEWVPKWGYKGRNKEGEGEWIVEVDEKKGGREEEGRSVRGEGRRERVEKVRRNERKQRANDRKGRKAGGGGGGGGGGG